MQNKTIVLAMGMSIMEVHQQLIANKLQPDEYDIITTREQLVERGINIVREPVRITFRNIELSTIEPTKLLTFGDGRERSSNLYKSHRYH